MIPERKHFQAGNSYTSTITEFDFSKVKAAFEYVVDDVVDTEDQYSGFKCTLGDVPCHVYRPNSTIYRVTFAFGPNDEYKLNYGDWFSLAGIVVYKGSTGFVFELIPNGIDAIPFYIYVDTISGIIWTYSEVSNSTYKVRGYKFEDNTITYSEKSVYITAGTMPGDTDKNYTDQAKLKKFEWFDTMYASAPAVYKASILTSNPNNGEIVQLDSKYYLSLINTNFVNASSSYHYINRRSYGSVVVPLGE